MPRVQSGVYELPSGNPVEPNTTISSAWANTTFGDVENALTDSLDRQGRGGMSAPLSLTDGTEAAPALSFNDESISGLYRAGLNDLRFSVQAIDLFRMYDDNLGERVLQINTDTGFKNLLYEGSIDTLPVANADKELLIWNETGQIWDTTFAASEDVTYDATISGLSANNVKAALDELAATGGGSSIPDGTINEESLIWSASLGEWTANFPKALYTTFTPYLGLSATNVQLAIQQLYDGAGGGGSPLPGGTVSGQQLVWNDPGQSWSASDAPALRITFDNSGTGLTSTNVNAAIAEVNTKVPEDGTVLGQTLRWNNTAYEASSAMLVDNSNNVLFANAVQVQNTNNNFDINGGGQMVVTVAGASEMIIGPSRTGIGIDPAAASKLDVGGAIYTNNLPLTNGFERFRVMTEVAYNGITPDANTVYFLT